jgi:hypothetical protein
MPTENQTTSKQQRAEYVNLAIRIISEHGRRFFFNQGRQTMTVRIICRTTRKPADGCRCLRCNPP